MKNHNLPLRRVRALIGLSILLTALGNAEANAQVILYDNTGVADFIGRTGPTGGPRPITPEDASAQQFLTGDFDNVSSVTLALTRRGSPPSGQLRIEIWDDNGSGEPGTFIGAVGSIDISSLPTEHEFFTFDDPITGLSPNSPYYVVLPPHPAIDHDNNYQWGVLTSSEGTNGASLGLIADCMTTFWCETAPLIGPPPPQSGLPAGALSNYWQMSVTAVPEPSAIALGLFGLAALGMFRIRGNGLSQD